MWNSERVSKWDFLFFFSSFERRQNRICILRPKILSLKGKAKGLNFFSPPCWFFFSIAEIEGKKGERSTLSYLFLTQVFSPKKKILPEESSLTLRSSSPLEERERRTQNTFARKVLSGKEADTFDTREFSIDVTNSSQFSRLTQLRLSSSFLECGPNWVKGPLSLVYFLPTNFLSWEGKKKREAKITPRQQKKREATLSSVRKGKSRNKKVAFFNGWFSLDNHPQTSTTTTSIALHSRRGGKFLRKVLRWHYRVYHNSDDSPFLYFLLSLSWDETWNVCEKKAKGVRGMNVSFACYAPLRTNGDVNRMGEKEKYCTPG